MDEQPSETETPRLLPTECHEALYQAYLVELREKFPRFEVIKKGQSRVNRVIDKFLKVITFGGQSSYLTSYVTTLGQKIYVPDDWGEWSPGARYCTMRHEAIHIRQFRRFTWPGMALLYVLLPLPVGFSGRKFIELPAYCESLTATWQLYGEAEARSDWGMDVKVSQFTGASYAWMWLNGGSIRRAFERHLDGLAIDPPPALPLPEGFDAS